MKICTSTTDRETNKQTKNRSEIKPHTHKKIQTWKPTRATGKLDSQFASPIWKAVEIAGWMAKGAGDGSPSTPSGSNASL